MAGNEGASNGSHPTATPRSTTRKDSGWLDILWGIELSTIFAFAPPARRVGQATAPASGMSGAGAPRHSGYFMKSTQGDRGRLDAGSSARPAGAYLASKDLRSQLRSMPRRTS